MDVARARALLKVDSRVSRSEVDRAFRLASLACHPDKHPNDTQAKQRFLELSSARNCAAAWAPQYQCEQVRGEPVAAPEGGGPANRKRPRTGGARAQKKAAQKLLTAEGGFVDKGRMIFRGEGGTLATGNKRSCLPDALFVLLSGLGHQVELEDVRSIIPVAGNTLFSDADALVRGFGLSLDRVTKDFMGPGGLAYQLLQKVAGSFVVQLRVTYGKEDREPDMHCVAYDCLTIKDNHKYTKVKILEESDRTVQGARAVFDSLLPGLQVRVTNIYELS